MSGGCLEGCVWRVSGGVCLEGWSSESKGGCIWNDNMYGGVCLEENALKCMSEGGVSGGFCPEGICLERWCLWRDVFGKMIFKKVLVVCVPSSYM